MSRGATRLGDPQLSGYGSEWERRGAICARLGERRGEIEEAIISRVSGIADPGEVGDPEYVDGLLATVSAAIDYALCAIERGEQRTPDPPAALLVQARMAARHRVGLDTVIRRYVAGYTVLGSFLIREVEEEDQAEVAALAGFLHANGVIMDRLIATVSEEYLREATSRPDSIEQRRVERVERLLAGELIDTSDLAYDFDARHLAVVAVGPTAPQTLRDLAARLDCQLLLVRRDETVWWGWLGTSRTLDSEEVRGQLARSSSGGLGAAIGESSAALSGWRLSHRQAASAIRIGQRSGERIVRYADLALLVAILDNELVVTSIRQLYLRPLERHRDHGQSARETLRAYFQVDRNISSAAALLGVSRNTVAHRLRTIEESLGRPISSCSLDLEAAMLVEPLITSNVGR